MWATTRTVSLQGAVGHVIDVQVDVSTGQAQTAMVGRPDTAITEARERCRAALDNSGFDWPVTKRITILLSPADVPKRGPHFDLSIAIGVIAAMDDQMPRAALAETALIGELTLDGRLRCVPGVLPMAMAAARHGVRSIFVPEPQVAEASLVKGLTVYGVRSLQQVVAIMKGEAIPDAPPVIPLTSAPLLSWVGEASRDQVDFADVMGMADARYSIEVAAVGGHHLHLTGPRGSGKTTLAERIAGILPDLDADERLELTAIHSLAGSLPGDGQIPSRPPFRAPHHSSSRTALLGGGSGRVRPGEVSKAHLGVLFLDEFPLFPRDVIEALREPLEGGLIVISRGEEDATFPARSMVVVASNPCPCGEFHPNLRDNKCRCQDVVRRNYRSKLSGPIIDRVDITRYVEPVRQHELTDVLEVPEPTAVLRERVLLARERQAERYRDHDWRLNAHVPGPALRELWPMVPEAMSALRTHVLKGRLTQRGGVRVHRVAWSVADLFGLERPDQDCLITALALREGAPLAGAVVRRRKAS
ncbi:MAG: ATP-binding protein [Myxococcales bacterium]|nr:MAG: ATP-binding protein [Myxococcales bacterium]